MSTLFIDGSRGVAGDMILGSLLGHVDPEKFLAQMSGIAELQIQIIPTQTNGIAGVSVEIQAKRDVQERHLRDIISIVETSGLPVPVQKNAMTIFQRLAEVEAAIHKVDIEQLHFHEVGALDSIGDIVGASLLFSMIGPDQVICSPLNLGTGSVECAHGHLEVPVPAVRALLADFPHTVQTGQGERTTPTGAAIVTHFSGMNGNMPDGQILSTGYGFGKRQFADGNYLKTVLVRD